MRMSSSDQRGFTLVELLIAMVVGTVVMTAALTMLVSANRAQKDVEDRVEAVQRGRALVEEMARPLRAMSCPLTTTFAVTAASSDSITFFADADADQDFDPIQYRMSAVMTNGRLSGARLERWDGVAVPAPPATITAPATTTRTLATNLSPALSDTGAELPLLNYGYYTTRNSETMADVPAGTVPANFINRLVRFDVRFSAQPIAVRGSTRRDVSSQQETSIYARNVSREATTPSFECTG